ncbi:hypothetical protein BSU04_04100 [Caballeronia sordidicola]|uniref:Uncharacterized protein n=1 Tax=Caballeronia sordidicola TaxID=196367 RepID=A0A226XAW4_CABSO|nr:hypothetical protein BSU04_04100 [Caballeronia sordidicola]
MPGAPPVEVIEPALLIVSGPASIKMPGLALELIVPVALCVTPPPVRNRIPAADPEIAPSLMTVANPLSL